MTTTMQAQGPSTEGLAGIRKAALLYATGRTPEALAELEADLHAWGDSYPVAWTMILEINRAERRRDEISSSSSPGRTQPGQVHLSEGLGGALMVALCGDLRDWGIEHRIAEQVGDRTIVSLDFAEAGRITPEAAIAITQLIRELRAGGKRVLVANLDEISAQLFLEVQRDVPGYRKSREPCFPVAARAVA